MRWGWLMVLTVLASHAVWAQTFPDYIEKQIRSGAITRAEAKLLYGNQVKSAATPKTAPTLAPPPQAMPVEQAATPPKAEPVKVKEPPFRGVVTGLQTGALTPGAVTGTVYLLQDTPELQEKIKAQQTLIASLQRSGARQSRAIGDGGVPQDGTLSRVAAARAQVNGYETIATGATIFGQAQLQEGKFAFKADVESGLLMVIARGGERIIGVWSTPIAKDQPIALDPGSALYWVP